MQPKKLLAGAFNHLSECRYGYMLYNINDTYMGGSLDRYGEFSEGEGELFRQVVQPGSVVVDVGANIGANLQADQAAADLRVAQAQAEKRRALAVAKEQEMKAQVEENRAKVVLAEAEVPMAISQAFRDGRLGVMDYYNLRNLQSDTEMRNAIASTGRPDRGEGRQS